MAQTDRMSLPPRSRPESGGQPTSQEAPLDTPVVTESDSKATSRGSALRDAAIAFSVTSDYRAEYRLTK